MTSNVEKPAWWTALPAVRLYGTRSGDGDRPGVFDLWATCSYVVRMPKMIRLRHVPDQLHRKLKARAALEGLSLSDYLLREVQRAAERPTLAELRQRLARRTPVATRVPPAKAVRAERGRGDRRRRVGPREF